MFCRFVEDGQQPGPKFWGSSRGKSPYPSFSGVMQDEYWPPDWTLFSGATCTLLGGNSMIRDASLHAGRPGSSMLITQSKGPVLLS